MRNYLKTSYENYSVKTPMKYLDTKYINNNSISNINNNLSFEMSNNFFQKNEPGPYPTLLPESDKSYKNLLNKSNNYNFTALNPYNNKDYYYKDYYQIETYQPENYGLYEDNSINSSFQTNWNIRPTVFYSQSIDYKNNNKYNAENKRYPSSHSNHSYYESKYTKKKNEYKTNINIYQNNNNKSQNQLTNLNLSKDKNKNSNTNLNKISLNSNKNNILQKNINDRYEYNIDNSPSYKKINENMNKLTKEKINNNTARYSSDLKKRNILLKNSHNISENKTLNIYNNNSNNNNNSLTKTIIQPRTPSINSHIKMHSPFKKMDKNNNNNNQEFVNEMNYNRSERNLPNTVLEKIPSQKLILTQSKNQNIVKYNKKLDMSDDNYGNQNQHNNKMNPFKLDTNREKKIINTPMQMKITKIYSNLNKDKDKKYKNNTKINININNTNENKNFIKNIELKPSPKNNNIKLKEQKKNHIEKLDISKKEDKIKANLKKKKKTNIQAIKILDSNKIKNIITSNNNDIKNRNNKTNIVLTQTKSTKINDKNNNQKTTIKPKINNYEEESNYMKEIENIMYDNYTEPRAPIKYNFKEENKNLVSTDNNKINNKTVNMNNLIKGKEIKEKYSLTSLNDVKKNINNENFDVSNNNRNKKNNNINQVFFTIYNASNIDNEINSNNKLNNSKTGIIHNNTNTNKIVNKNDLQKSSLNKNIESIVNNKNNSKSQKKTITIKTKNIINSNKDNKDNKENKDNNTKYMKKKEPEKKEINDCHSKFKKIEQMFHNDDDIIEPYNEKENTKKINARNATINNQKKYRLQDEYPTQEDNNNDNKKKSEHIKEKIGDEWDSIQYKGMIKKTYEPGRRSSVKAKKGKKEKKDSILNNEFCSSLYIRSSEVITIAGKNELGKKKTNQDTYILEKNVNGVLNFNIFGVLDGHGENGHLASHFVSRYVINRIKNHPLIKKLDEPKEIYNQLISDGYEIIANIYLDADAQIQKEKFDVSRSGTTIVLVIQLEEHIICANTGDSRAIIVFDENEKDNLVDSKIYPLSYDCKPELPNERKRIYQCGGVVEKAYYSDDEDDQDEYIPFRVWAKGEDYPGLAMSRSIGDTDAKKVGVIANPQIVEYSIDYYSKYLLICSDGIWEFITSEDAMYIGNKFYLRNDPIGLCHELSRKSIELWEEKDVVIDDITVLVVFF